MGTPHYRPPDSSALDFYPIRIMVGLIVSLVLLLVLVHLPVYPSTDRVGLSSGPHTDRIILHDAPSERPEEPSSPQDPGLPPPTVVSQRQPPKRPSAPSSSQQDTGSNASSSDAEEDRSQRYKRLQSVTELGLSDDTPRIKGGTGSLYLHIQYPAEARRQGIEGHLELEFTVEPNGSVTGLDVVKSLHPLCDSAAVEGVRSVEFVPAKKNGTPVPIRLRLPVEFRLTTVTGTGPPTQ